MLYRPRDASGVQIPYSSGTYVDAQGKAKFLRTIDFSLVPGETWRSPNSGARYPIAWSISVPSLGLRLSEQTPMKDQELFTTASISPVYWEGTVSYEGQMHGHNVKGVGYLEMTGYDKAAR
jgi:predicted secreted hydrolase